MAIAAHGISDLGKHRDSNQDQFLIAELRRSLIVHQSSLPGVEQAKLKGPAFAQLLAVADGVGGSQGGERASYLAVRTILEYTLNMLPWCVRMGPGQEGYDFTDELSFALDRCQTRLHAEGHKHPSRARMATTLTMAFVVWPRAWVIHVGDSRCYRLRAGALEQVTLDQTVAQELARHGALSESGALRSPFRNTLSNSLSAGSDHMEPAAYALTLEPGDLLLICSDGLTKHVSDERLHALLSEDRPVDEVCQALVDEANQGDDGGSDNITCVVARFPDDPDAPRRLA